MHEECGIIDDTTGQPQQQHVTAVSHHAAMMLLQLKQKYKLSQVALDAVTEEFIIITIVQPRMYFQNDFLNFLS